MSDGPMGGSKPGQQNVARALREGRLATAGVGVVIPSLLEGLFQATLAPVESLDPGDARASAGKPRGAGLDWRRLGECWAQALLDGLEGEAQSWGGSLLEEGLEDVLQLLQDVLQRAGWGRLSVDVAGLENLGVLKVSLAASPVALISGEAVAAGLALLEGLSVGLVAGLSGLEVVGRWEEPLELTGLRLWVGEASHVAGALARQTLQTKGG